MFNFPILDIAIGLVFIFLLYSLLAMAINEFISTLFAYRARMLEKALRSILDGKGRSVYWWDIALNQLLQTLHQRRAMFRDKPTRNTLLIIWRWIKHIFFMVFSVFSRNGNDTSSEQAREFHTGKLKDIGGYFATKVTTHPLYLRLGGTRFFKKPAYITPGTFSSILLDVLNGDPLLPKNMNNMQAAVKKLANKDTRNILQLYIEQANGDLQRFKILVEDWYNESMDRVTGWYKRQSQVILLIIGFVLATAFNVSTLDVVAKLSHDDKAREGMAKVATDYIRTHPRPAVPDSNYANAERTLKEVDSLYKKDIQHANVMLALGWGNFGRKGQEQLAWYDKVLYVLGETFTAPRRLLGFILTAMAISLGAPFWFDVLNKVVNIRGVGKAVPTPAPAAASAAPGSGATSTSQLNNFPDPKAKG